MSVILFQGDSITDGERQQSECGQLGYGYPAYVAGRLGLGKPGAYTFCNRGISGNRVVDVYARIKQDIINLQPDYMSLLIGVNDVWHELAYQNGIDRNKFRVLYQMLLDEVLEALPHIKIILMEPFVLRAPETDEQYSLFRKEVELRAEVVCSLSAEYNFPLIRLQEDLDAMEQSAPQNYWLRDGVHPTAYFHQYIADKWLETFHTLL